MKKFILLLTIFSLVNGACREEESPYRNVFGFYDGSSFVSDSTLFTERYFCEGLDFELKDLGNDNVMISAYCKTWSKESLNEFKNLKIGKSRIDTINTTRWPIVGRRKQPVQYSITDIKTGKEVAYIFKYSSTPYRILADSLLSTKGVYLRLYFGDKK